MALQASMSQRTSIAAITGVAGGTGAPTGDPFVPNRPPLPLREKPNRGTGDSRRYPRSFPPAIPIPIPPATASAAVIPRRTPLEEGVSTNPEPNDKPSALIAAEEGDDADMEIVDT